MKIKIQTRKVYNQPFTSVIIHAKKDDGIIHDKQFIVKSLNKGVVKGQISLFLKNITQKASVVEII